MLDYAEYKDFAKKSEANHEARGGYTPPTSEEDMRIGYDIMNKITADKDGLSITDIFTFWGAMGAAKQQQ